MLFPTGTDMLCLLGVMLTDQLQGAKASKVSRWWP